jgi:hypothetical protein
MEFEWRSISKKEKLKVEGETITFAMEDGRTQRVTISENDKEFILSSIVVRRKIVEDNPDIPMEAWIKNRSMQLIGFRIDDAKRLVAEVWLPKVGLTSDEFLFRLKMLAAEADRYEYILTGKDVE